MSATAYSNPYKLPAGALALAVHGAFFVLLYFGVSWQAQPPQGMVVDIWDSLPESQIVPVMVEPPPLPQAEPPPPVEPPPLAKVEPPPPVKTVPASPPPKADIEIEKKKPPAKPVEIRTPIVPPKAVVPEKTDAEQVDLNAQAAQQAIAEQERVRAEQAAGVVAAITNEVEKHKRLIQSKIRSRIVLLSDVPGNAKAEFDVTLLPDGSVFSVKLVKSSGFEVYDSAVESAIFKAQLLPLPPDAALFNKFRKLHLKFCPEENSCK